MNFPHTNPVAPKNAANAPHDDPLKYDRRRNRWLWGKQFRHCATVQTPDVIAKYRVQYEKHNSDEPGE